MNIVLISIQTKRIYIAKKLVILFLIFFLVLIS